MMKAVVCELCGSNDIIKKEGYFECQHCGTKHVLKRDMVYETPEMKRERNKQEKLDEIENILMLARQAVKRNDAENVIKYFDEYFHKLFEYENDIGGFNSTWDSHFYPDYYKLMMCPVQELLKDYSRGFSAGTIFSIMTEQEFSAGKHFTDDYCVETASKVSNCYMEIANRLYDAAMFSYNKADNGDKEKYTKELIDRCSYAIRIFYDVGNALTYEHYAYHYDKRLVELGVAILKDGYAKYLEVYAQSKCCCDMELGYKLATTIMEHDKTFVPAKFIKKPKEPKKRNNGCYIATCVYGSYDCPEVWVLRRFRDSVLAKSVLGRLSINFYYAVSPRLVSKFGKSNLFRKIWQKPLNALVSLLRQKGFEDTPYND